MKNSLSSMDGNMETAKRVVVEALDGQTRELNRRNYNTAF